MLAPFVDTFSGGVSAADFGASDEADGADTRLAAGGSAGTLRAGGSDTGGSDTGGSDTGGSDTGGSDIGGSDIGGSDVGGSDAGGELVVGTAD